MISGLTPAARAATNSEESIVPCARLSRMSTGVATTSAANAALPVSSTASLTALPSR